MQKDLLSQLKKREKELVDAVSELFQSTAFDNRFTLHPRRLAEMVQEEVDGFKQYVGSSDMEEVHRYGEGRSQEGLNFGTIHKYFSLLRDFVIADAAEPAQLRVYLEIVDSYALHYLISYTEDNEKQIMADQEHLRLALSTALERQRRELYVKNYAINTSRNGIMLTDLEGKITYLNPAFANMWGLNDVEQILYTSSVDYWDKSSEVDSLETIIKEGSWLGEIDTKRSDGAEIQVSISASLIRDESSQPLGIMAFFIDVTEQKRLEAQFRQAQKMEALGQLAGGIVHDFNNLLTAISGYTQLELMDLPKDSHQYQDFMQIKLATDKGKELTEELRVFTRQATSHLVVLNLNRMIDEIYKLLKRTFPPEIKIKMVFDPALHSIKANPSQMSQMIMNLCVNARDAILSMRKDRGEENEEELCLQTSNVELNAAQASRYLNAKPGDYVRITVKDSGKGMSGEVMDRLFEPFFTTKGEKRGTGLGLAVVYGTVQNHGGFIDIKSILGEGSTFDVFLPVSKDTCKESSVKAFSGNLTAGRGTILVVEDEPQVRKMIQMALEKSGYAVITAENGVEAVSQFQRYQSDIDLVILDMVMPKMGGHQCFHELKRIDSEIKIIIITGYTTDGSADDFVEEGALRVIEKPFELDVFTEIVRQAIS